LNYTIIEGVSGTYKCLVALLFAKYLRNEKEKWIARNVQLKASLFDGYGQKSDTAGKKKLLRKYRPGRRRLLQS